LVLPVGNDHRAVFVASTGDENAGCAPPNSTGSYAMAKPAKRDYFLDLQRPHCPQCKMRMIATDPARKTYECLRCGYVQRSSAEQAAE
jgi:ribosomal protein S27AE